MVQSYLCFYVLDPLRVLGRAVLSALARCWERLKQFDFRMALWQFVALLMQLGTLCGAALRRLKPTAKNAQAAVRRLADRPKAVQSGAVLGPLPANEPQTVSRRRKRRWYHMFRGRGVALIALGLVFTCSAGWLISYGVDLVQSRRASNEMRQLYHEDDTPQPAATPAPSPVPTRAAVAAKQTAPAPKAFGAPTATPETRLRPTRYPNNPNALISARFQKLRRQNKDVVGWLSIDGLVDEAVVQRDNSYYLKRDYLGYHNVNGAIFLEESCDITKRRPYTLTLYGHNMKTGAMFGGLRKYENVAYYKQNPFITFDTAYEQGRYVVFASSLVKLTPGSHRYVDFSKLNSSIISCREDAIQKLKDYSSLTTGVDVQPQDQLLLLVTCVDDDRERRIVAARRVRDDEQESDLAWTIQCTARKSGH